jgi:hypothetical protein
MFDANMRHLPLNTMFFAKVHSCVKGSVLHTAGARAGDVLIAKMLSQKSEDPEVMFVVKGELVQATSDYNMLHWLVYAGNLDGTDFICSETYDKAIAVPAKEVALIKSVR